jgi:ring-1,2-phenylacetyl-CoA epoxidase subunit PaaD
MDELTHFKESDVWQWLQEISDPEVPVLTIIDLGIVRKVHVYNKTQVIIDITPTYSGCPAMDVISMQIRMVLLSKGVKKVDINLVLEPAWTTDWMTEDGKLKLKEYGIAPPTRIAHEKLGLFEEDKVKCPKCNSDNTVLISQFGATSCKSMYKCNDCLEPFEHFKCH